VTASQGSGNQGGDNQGVHLQYKVDLSNPTPESLEAIKNELVQKIAQNIDAERRGLEETEEMRHDRHYSIHSSDPA
jgi:ABC-type Fe3+-citrate transport system substrate-binding protein